MALTIKLRWRYIEPPPMTGALADLKVWVMDTGEPELEDEFRKLLGLMRRNGISDERVNAMADELYVLVTGKPLRLESAVLDHCHRTGRVRAVTHRAANSAEGGYRVGRMARLPKAAADALIHAYRRQYRG
ncbi:hypothetical protein ACNZ9R_000546 [Escherichia coli]